MLLFLNACLFETETPPIPSSEFAPELAHLAEAPNPLLAAYGLPQGGSVVGVQFAFRTMDYAGETRAAIDHFRVRTGVDPASVGAYFDFSSRPEHLRIFLETAATEGCVPSITLDPKDWDDPDWKYQKTFLSLILKGNFDDTLDGLARALADFGRPVLLRFAHEMNGDWYPYAGGGDGDGDGRADGPEVFIRAWRYVHARFAAAGTPNVLWSFCPNAEDFPDRDWNRPFRYYPGDTYADLISVDAYEHAGKKRQSLSEALDPFLARLGAFLRARLLAGNISTPSFGLGEFGTDRGDKADKAAWYAQTLAYLSTEDRIRFNFLYDGRNGAEDFSLAGLGNLLEGAYRQPGFIYRLANDSIGRIARTATESIRILGGTTPGF